MSVAVDDYDGTEADDAPMVPLGDVLAASTRARSTLADDVYVDFKRKLAHAPSAHVAERELIADILTHEGEALRLAEEAGVAPTHFASAILGVIFAAAQAAAARGEAVTLASVLDALLRSGEDLEAQGGEAFLHDLCKHAAGSHGLAHLHLRVAGAAASVVEKSRLRGAIEVARKLAARAHVHDGNSSEIIGEAVTALGSIEACGATGVVDNREIAKRVRARMPALGGTRRVVPTGLPAVDDYFAGGVEPGDLVIVAARPSMGKTAFVCDWCDYLSVKKRQRTLFFSYEMSAEQLMGRMAGARANINTNRPRSKLSDEDRMAIDEAMDDIENSPLCIVDAAGLGIGGIASRAKSVARDGDLSLVVVDYLTLIAMRAAKDTMTRDGLVGEVTRGLKMLARTLDCPVVCLSQLNRGVESRPNKRPLMSDLRESGNIEQDADVICFLFREEYYERERTPEDKKGIAELIVSKNRNGAAGSALRLRFGGAGTPRFSSLAHDHDVDSAFFPSTKKHTTHHDRNEA